MHTFERARVDFDHTERRVRLFSLFTTILLHTMQSRQLRMHISFTRFLWKIVAPMTYCTILEYSNKKRVIKCILFIYNHVSESPRGRRASKEQPHDVFNTSWLEWHAVWHAAARYDPGLRRLLAGWLGACGTLWGSTKLLLF